MTDRLLTIAILLIALLLPSLAPACTIVSAVANNGEVWNMNNEDGPPGVANFINVFPRTDSTLYGYYTLSYLSPKAGEGGGTQGGMNEAGLTYDFNAMHNVDDFDLAGRQTFPKGDNAILAHIMGKMQTVDEVIAFFETYWFTDGFRSAQMHVADREGRFAIISASGVYVAEVGQPLISTNFDICAGEDGGNCWRYPVAEEKLATREVGLATMLSIALDTRQKEYTTVYSNVQNLTTGDIWFMSYHDPGRLAQINILNLLERGRKSYSFSDLAYLENGIVKDSRDVDQISGSELPTDSLIGTYRNNYVGDIVVESQESGLKVTYANGAQDLYTPGARGVYGWEDGDEAITFERDEKSGTWLLNLYTNGWWSVTSERLPPQLDAGK